MARKDGAAKIVVLEGNIFVADGARCGCRLGFGSPLIEVVSSRGRATRASSEVSATASFAAAAQQDQIIHDDLSHVFLLPGLLVVPGVRAQAAFDVHLRALLEILAGNFRGARPGGDVVPLGAVLPLTFLVLVTIVGGQRELRHRCAAGRGPELGILAKIADENDLVDALTCHKCCSFRPFAWTQNPGSLRKK